MPLFYQHNINDDERLGVWKIEENEDFFLNKVPPNPEITHEHKRLQHLAGRYLLQQLFPNFPYELIQIADTRKPFLFNEAYHFSISHCDNYAAALVSRRRRVGVDIEIATATIAKVQHKFLNDFEMEILHDIDGATLLAGDKAMRASTTLVDTNFLAHQHNTMNTQAEASGFEHAQELISEVKDPGARHLELLTLCWSAKEAMYKWYGQGLVDFRSHMQLNEIEAELEEGWVLSKFVFQKEKPVPLLLKSRFFGDTVLSYVIS